MCLCCGVCRLDYVATIQEALEKSPRYLEKETCMCIYVQCRLDYVAAIREALDIYE